MSSVSVEVRKSQHKYVVGPRGGGLQVSSCEGKVTLHSGGDPSAPYATLLCIQDSLDSPPYTRLTRSFVFGVHALT